MIANFIHSLNYATSRLPNLKVRVWAIFFTILLSLSISLSSIDCYAQKIAVRGVLDLTTFDFESSDPLPLNGEWQFFWKQLVPPKQSGQSVPQLVTFPHLWNDYEDLDPNGYATYRLKILLPRSYPSLALTIPDMYSSYELFIEDELVAKNGTVGTSKENYSPRWEPSTITLEHYDTQTIDLTLHIANFDHSKGGIRVPIYIGKKEILIREREVKLGYTFLLTGSLIMAALFFLGLFFFGKEEKTIFYFSLFCLVYSYRIIGTELYPLHYILTDIPWIVTLRLEYLSLYLSAALFGVFVKNLFPAEASKKIMNVFNSLFLGFTITSIILPPFYFTSILNYFFGLLTFYIAYTSWVLIRARIKKRVGSGFALASVIVVFMVFIYDLFEYFMLFEENLFVNFSGYITFFFLQALTLSNRFSNTLQIAKEEAETASTAKTHFLSTMGHELRTPLNAVIGFSELLLDSRSEKEKTHYAQTIKKSGENLLSIINNILDFTKIESDTIDYKFEPVHLPSLLAEVVKMLGSLTDPKKVKLSFRFDDSLSDYIETDGTRLKQILINLIGNAIKFTDEGEISVQVTTTQSISEKGQILFIVKDTGIGIPEEKLGLLFDRFSQIETDRNRRYGGTGLGLAISKRLIEGMKGRVWVQSKLNSGTTFYFTIKNKPISEKNAEKLKLLDTHADSSEPDKNISILIVEDNIINQKVIQKVLERLGFSSEIADNGFKALEMVQKNSFDLVFMDMEMPEMDGIEATKQIKSLGTKAYSPIIIAMTANVSAEDKRRCFEAGMVDFISKPITLKTTLEIISKWFPVK